LLFFPFSASYRFIQLPFSLCYCTLSLFSSRSFSLYFRPDFFSIFHHHLLVLVLLF
jgi:hypothetical protein